MQIHRNSPNLLAPPLTNSSQPFEKVGIVLENRASLLTNGGAIERDHESVFGAVEREDFAPQRAADAGEGGLLLD